MIFFLLCLVALALIGLTLLASVPSQPPESVVIVFTEGIVVLIIALGLLVGMICAASVYDGGDNEDR